MGNKKFEALYLAHNHLLKIGKTLVYGINHFLVDFMWRRQPALIEGALYI